MEKLQSFDISTSTNVFSYGVIEIKNEIIDSLKSEGSQNQFFFMRTSKWKRNLWRTSFWSCHQFYVIMCLEWHLKNFLPVFLYCLLFIFHYMLTWMRERFRKIYFSLHVTLNDAVSFSVLHPCLKFSALHCCLMWNIRFFCLTSNSTTSFFGSENHTLLLWNRDPFG